MTQTGLTDAEERAYLEEQRLRNLEVSLVVTPGSVWASPDGVEVFVVDDFDGAYGYVTNVAGSSWPESSVQWAHFGKTYLLITP